MNDEHRRQSGPRVPALTDEEYAEALILRDKLNAQISEYENETRRGSLKVFRTKCGINRDHDGFSIRYDWHLGARVLPHWHTITTLDTERETLEFLRVMARDFPAVYEGFKSKMEGENEDE